MQGAREAACPDGCIFISYRRGADNNSAGRLYDRLENAFGAARLFMDIDAIPPGIDFVAYLDEQVSRCEAFLAVVGPGGLAEAARLRDPADFVRIEIAAALDRPHIPIIPVLIDNARLPAADELPEDRRPLLRRHAVRLPHDHFASVVDRRLAPELKKVLGDDPGADSGGAQRSARPAPALYTRELDTRKNPVVGAALRAAGAGIGTD